MESCKVDLLLMAGSAGDSEPESIVAEGKYASVKDLISTARQVSRIRRIILSTSSEILVDRLDGTDVEIIPDDGEGEFHFGVRLNKIIEEYQIENLLYFGAGSGVLLNVEDFEALVSLLDREGAVAIANNFYSTDFIALKPADKLLSIPPVDRDNLLGWKSREAGYDFYELQRSGKTQFDIDTPVDLLSLKMNDDLGRYMRGYLTSVSSFGINFEDYLPYYTDSGAKIVLAGRIGASTWNYLERNAACRFNVYSEGRGTYASSGSEGKKISSLLGSLVSSTNWDDFFAFLSETGDILFLDTRVLYYCNGLWPSCADRFWSDLKQPEKINSDFVKELTRAALDCDKPVILGGHSLVSGTQYLLVDFAWELFTPLSKRIQLQILSLDLLS